MHGPLELKGSLLLASRLAVRACPGMAVPDVGSGYVYYRVRAFSCNICNREYVQIWRRCMSVMLVCGCCVVCPLVLCMCGVSSCAGAYCVVVVWVPPRAPVPISLSSQVLLLVKDM